MKNLTITQILNRLSSRDFSCKELVQHYINNINNSREINAFIADDFDKALAKADLYDNQKLTGLLAGIPLAIKDIFATKGMKTTACSKILADFIPPYESTVTYKLWQEGAIMLGKVNMDEFAMGSANINSHYGPVISPLRAKNAPDQKLTAGGSSGGSAAAVSGDLCAAALGTDTGGSVRQPAAYNGIVGFKPSYGRCSRYGIIAFASSLDQAGVLTRSVEDAALLYGVMSGYDEKDSTCSQRNDRLSDLNVDWLKGKKIGIPREYVSENQSDELREITLHWQELAEKMRLAGAEIVEISLPHTKYAPAVYYIIASAECSSNLARYDGVRYGYRADPEEFTSLDEMYEKTRAGGFGDEVKRRIMIGTYVLSAGYFDAYYKKALAVRHLIAEDFSKAFASVDMILTPTAPSSAFALNAKLDDPIKMYLNDIYTIPASLAGLPAISIPYGTISASGLPIGMQLIAPRFDEQNLLNAALAVEAMRL